MYIGLARNPGLKGVNLPFTPKKIPGLVRWFKGDTQTGANLSAVTSWTDSAGIQNLSSVNTNEQPQLLTGVSGLNNMPVVRFNTDGSSARLMRSNQTGLPSGSQARSVYMVFRPLNGYRSSVIFWGNNGTDNRCWNVEYNSQANGYIGIVTATSGINYVRAQSAPNRNGAFTLMGLTYAAGANIMSTKVWLDCVEYALTQISGTNIPPDTQVVTDNFILGAGAAAWAQMDVAELVVYNTDLDTASRQKLEGYLAWRWGLQSLLPVGHSYKNAGPTYRLDDSDNDNWAEHNGVWVPRWAA